MPALFGPGFRMSEPLGSRGAQAPAEPLQAEGRGSLDKQKLAVMVVVVDVFCLCSC